MVASPTRSSPEHADALADDDAAWLGQVGARLRRARAQRGMTRRVLAAQSGVSERYLAQMEAGGGNASIVLLRAIARALGTEPAALLSDSAGEAPAGCSMRHLEGLLGRLTEAQSAEARSLLQRHFAGRLQDNRGRRIALIGLRGAGKSTLGRRLAEARETGFIELDREIEREAGMELREIFERQGQRGFRRLERQVLARLLQQPDGIIATGGSIVADPSNFALLLRGCLTIWVRATPEEHMQRVLAQGDLRPMQDNRAAMDDLRAILASREDLYARADLVLDTGGRTLEQSVAALLQLVADA